MFCSAQGTTESTAKHINQLLEKGIETIEETRLNVRADGLQLPFFSLHWPTPPKHTEVCEKVEGLGYGLRLTGKRGSAVFAPATGVIKYVGPMNTHNSVVIVDHQQQVQTIFFGLDENSVTIGQNVYSGQRLGRLPAYGPLIHEYFFELRHKGRAIDPMPYMKRKG